LLKAFSQWIHDHVQKYLIDLETPDHWSAFDKSKTVSVLLHIDYADSGKFTKEESAKVSAALDQLEHRMIGELNMQTEQITATRQAIGYVKDKLQGSDRLAWKLFFLGTIVNLVFVLSLDTERGNKLFQLIKEIFKGLWILPQINQHGDFLPVA
jgi:hypothetical protein